MDLTEFAETQRDAEPRAWVRRIPEWPEIEKAYAAGVGVPTIRRWLIDDRGYPEKEVTTGKLQEIYKTRARSSRG